METKASCRSILAVFIFIASFLLSDFAAADVGNVYWSSGSSRIGQADLNGQNVQTNFTSEPSQGLTLDVGDNKIYWTDPLAPAIQNADLDTGLNPDTILTAGLVTPRGIALDSRAGEGFIYWGDVGNVGIRRARLSDPSTIYDILPEAVLTAMAGGAVQPRQLALDLTNNFIYWAEREQSKIHKATLDGASTFTLTFPITLNKPTGLALDVSGGKMYWTENAAGGHAVIRKANLDGSDAITLRDLSTGDDIGIFPTNIAVDTLHGKIYWTAGDATGRIQRANLDGSGFEPNFITGITSPFGIAVHSFPELPAGAFPVLSFAMSSLVLALRRKFTR